MALIDGQRLWFKAGVGVDVQRLERDLAAGLLAGVRADATATAKSGITGHPPIGGTDSPSGTPTAPVTDT